MSVCVFEFNFPGLPQIHLRARLFPVDGPKQIEVTIRSEDRPAAEAVLAMAVAPLDDCSFEMDATQPRSQLLQVGSSTFQVPLAEAEVIKERFGINETA